MRNIVIRMLITALGLFLAARWVDGVHISGDVTFVIAALLLGFVNAFVRPVMLLLTLPLTLLTLGLFVFVVNAAMFGLVAALLDNFSVSGFLPALGGAIVVSITTLIAGWLVKPSLGDRLRNAFRG